MKQNSNNPINTIEKEDENNSNLKQKYNALKQKIANLIKNNAEILEMYKAEEQRLIKSNEFLMQNKNKENSKNIEQLEAEVLKMRNDIRQLQNIIEPRNGINLIENDDLLSNNSNNKLNPSTEEKIKEEYLINYKNKLKAEFEKKLIMKHQELIDFYTEQNKTIIENKLNLDNIMDIDEIKNFSIKPNETTISLNTLNTSLISDVKLPLDISKINLILSLYCLKEEYPKEFFIDYILDSAYTERGQKKINSDNKSNLTEYKNKNKKERSQSVIPLSFDVKEINNSNKIAEKICQLFDIKNKEDIDMIKNYINEILNIDINLRNYFETNLIKFRFAPYEKYEKDNYDKKIKKYFAKYLKEVKELLELDNNIINYQKFNEFMNKCLKEEEKEEDFIFYILHLMKLSKSERKNEKNNRLNNLKVFEFYLMPFYQKILN